MNVVGPEIENPVHFHLVKHWYVVISRKRSPHTEHDSDLNGIPPAVADNTHHEPAS